MGPRPVWEGRTLSVMLALGLVGPASERAFQSALQLLKGVGLCSHLRPHVLGLLWSFDLCLQVAVARFLTWGCLPGQPPGRPGGEVLCATRVFLGFLVVSGSSQPATQPGTSVSGLPSRQHPNSTCSVWSSAEVAKPQDRDGSLPTRLPRAPLLPASSCSVLLPNVLCVCFVCVSSALDYTLHKGSCFCVASPDQEQCLAWHV